MSKQPTHFRMVDFVADQPRMKSLWDHLKGLDQQPQERLTLALGLVIMAIRGMTQVKSSDATPIRPKANMTLVAAEVAHVLVNAVQELQGVDK